METEAIAPNPNEGPVRSTFITVFGWSAVVLSVLGVLGTGMMYGFFAYVMPNIQEQFGEELRDQMAASGAGWMLEDIGLWFLLWGLLSLTGIVVGVGLLKRRNWARISSIAYIGIMSAWQLYYVATGALYTPPMAATNFPADMPPELATQMQAQMAAMHGIMELFVIGMTVTMIAIHVWLIYKLSSRPIRREFAGPNPGESA